MAERCKWCKLELGNREGYKTVYGKEYRWCSEDHIKRFFVIKSTESYVRVYGANDNFVKILEFDENEE